MADIDEVKLQRLLIKLAQANRTKVLAENEAKIRKFKQEQKASQVRQSSSSKIYHFR